MATKKYLSLDKLGLYDKKIKKLMSDSDAAVLQSAKDYADGLADNYDSAGAAASALKDAKAYADGKDEAIAAAANAAADAASAASVADGKAVAAGNAASEAQADVDALSAFVGVIPDGYTEETIVAYINKKAQETLESASGGSSESAASVMAALNTYKSENDPKVNKNIEDIAALVSALDKEVARADEAEKANAAAIKAISDDYLKTADKTELQNNINTVSGAVERLTNGVSAEEIDGVNDLIQYVKDHGSEVTGMQEDIEENASAVDAVAGRMTTAEGKITAIEGAMETKVEQSAYDQKIAALEGVDAGIIERIAAVEADLAGDAEGTVAEQISAAKQEAIDAAAGDATTKAAQALADAKSYADLEDAKIESRVDALEAASAKHALASDLTALTGRVTTVEGKVSTLESEMDDVQALASANDAAHKANAAEIAKKASQSDFEAAVARIDAVEDWQKNMIEISEEEINEMFGA